MKRFPKKTNRFRNLIFMEDLITHTPRLDEMKPPIKDIQSAKPPKEIILISTGLYETLSLATSVLSFFSLSLQITWIIWLSFFTSLSFYLNRSQQKFSQTSISLATSAFAVLYFYFIGPKRA